MIHSKAPTLLKGLVDAHSHYPRAAKINGIQGSVQMCVSISSTGRVTDVEVVQSSGHKILDNAAVRSMQQVIFKPATKAGKPVEENLLQTIDYRLY